ncbi:sugar kinase [Alteromonas sp. KUL42]|nr:sugar kinase [Alteromonas sp. KUL42]
MGECMVELRTDEYSATSLHQSFAGDVYNSAVYLKRCFDDVFVGFVTVTGDDTFSHRMRKGFESESLDTSMVFTHPTRATGLYLIDTDDDGERSFTYWRSESAAKTIVSFLNVDVLNSLTSNDMFMFSGISIAIIPPDERVPFFNFIKALKNKGVKLVFDPNYRARLWTSLADAKANFEQALSLSDIALVGVEDMGELFGLASSDDVMELCQSHSVDEVVIKNGPSSVLTSLNGKYEEHVITPVSKVVDTTSAGDAFNGVYLGGRLQNLPISHCVSMAAKAAGTVIQHRGAIIPKGVVEATLEGVHKSTLASDLTT